MTKVKGSTDGHPCRFSPAACRPSSGGPLPLAAIGAEQNATGLLKRNDSDAMGPWPLNRNYLNAVDPLNQLADPLNQNYLTATGQRVPRPSVSQGAATTQPERKIKDKTKELDLAPIRQMT
jgi:hypothetical protein